MIFGKNARSKTVAAVVKMTQYK